MYKRVDPFLFGAEVIDLHGEDRYGCTLLLESFIKENVILGKDKIVIIHGKGSGIVKASVYQILKKNKYVESYNINNYNDGETIVYLKVRR